MLFGRSLINGVASMLLDACFGGHYRQVISMARFHCAVHDRIVHTNVCTSVGY